MDERLLPFLGRRSVRQYRRGAIPDEILHDILKVAMSAPSAHERDPWHFVAIRDPGTLRRLAEGLPNGRMLASAAAAIAVCGDLRRAHRQQLSYLLQDCSAAMQNILLAVAAIGLGGCWVGVHPSIERIGHVGHVLAVADGIIPIAVAAIGHPLEPPVPRTRFRRERVHWGIW
jgi:nitroreductase